MIKHTLTLLALSSIGGSHFLGNANNKNCLCLPRDRLSIPNSMNGVDTQRLVVYLYKSPGQQHIRVHIPNAVKQRLLPDFPVEDDDELIDDDQLTLQGIFGISKVVLINHKSLYNVAGAHMYPGINRYLNYQISNQFSKGVNIPNRVLHGSTYPSGLNLVNKFTPNIPFFGNFLHNYPISNGKNPNISGDVKITHGSINGPLYHTGEFNVPLNIYSEVNSKPNNLINHGTDLINVEGPDTKNPNYSGTINIKQNYPIQGVINDPANPNFSGDIKLTHDITGPLQQNGQLIVPLNIHSKVNSQPNNLINHGIDLINSENPDPISRNYSGTINIKHDYPIQGGISDPVNPNFSGNIKITHGSINGPLQHSGKLNIPLNIHSEVNSRPNNLMNPEIDLINTEIPDSINPNNSGTININQDYPIQGGINDPDNPNYSGDIKITHSSFNGPLQHSGNLNVPLKIHSEVNSQPSHLINSGINFLNTLNWDPNNPKSSGKTKLTHNFPTAGGITDPDNPNNSGMIKLLHNFPIGGGITDPDNPNYPGNLPHDFPVAGGITDLDNSNNSTKINIINGSINVPLKNSGKFDVPLNIHSEVNSRPSHLINSGINFLNTLNWDSNNPNNSGKTKLTHNFPIAGGITDPDNPNNSGMIKLIHNFPIGGGITDPDNPNNSGMIKLIHNFPIGGGITDPDNPNYPGNLPHDFPVAGGITDLNNSNHSSKINIINGSINVPLHNSGKFDVPLNIHSEVNSPTNLINPGTNLLNTEKILDFNIAANKIVIPGYDWEPDIDSIVDDREVNSTGIFHSGIINISNNELQPGINVTSTEKFVNPSIPLNPEQFFINGSISINPPVNGELVNLVNINPELINEPNNSTSPGITIQKILNSDENQINEVTVNPLHYDGNVNANITENNISGMINMAINDLTNTENKKLSVNQLEPGSTLNGKVKITSESHSKVIDEPNDTLRPDLEIIRMEKNKHSSSPVNSVTKILTYEDINHKLNQNVEGQVPGNIEFDVVSQQLNPGKEILSDPINITYKTTNFTIPGGINTFSDLLHSGGVHHKQLGIIPEGAQDTFLNLISDHSSHDNYEFSSFDDWLNHQITTSDSTLNIGTIRKLTEKILGENGIRIDKQGVLTDSDGNVFNLTKLKLVPLLIGSPVGYDTIIQNGVIYRNKINLPRNMRYKNSALIAFDDPFRILGIIPLGLSLTTGKRLTLDSKFEKLKTPIDDIKIDRTSYISSTTIKPAALPDLLGKPESLINYIQNYRSPCANGNCFSHRIVPGTEPKKERIYPKTNDGNTKIIYLNEPTDESKSILSAINFDQGAGEIIPVVQNMTRLLKKLIADIDNKKRAKDVIESPKDPEKAPPEYDEIPGFRIIGGNAATSSGTPVSSKGRSGIIT